MRTCPDCHNHYDDDVLHCPEDGRGLSDLPVEDELIGRNIGSYRVEKQLGKGGMGSVYMGLHPVIGSRVAIKFLHPQYAHDEKIVDRFFNEARAVNVIGHDNILKILDLNVTEDNRHYFVMEYLQGRALQALLKHNVSIPLDVTGPIIMQCCDALEAAHRKGIIHRDLKPDNVYLITMKGKKNFVKVVDFGIARVTDDSGMSTGKTQTGMVMGTPAYMSPEQGSGATTKIDGRSDVYSLGVMMYQLACGRLPFPGSNFGEVLIGHLQQPPPPPRSIKPEIPEAYEAIILKCLEKQQENRYQSMKELKHAVEACMDSLGISKELPQADETDPEMLPVENSKPGLRTPGRATPGPVSKSRISNPNARNSRPGAAVSRPGVGASRPPSMPSRPPTMAPEQSRAALFIGVGVAAVLVIGGGAFFLVRKAQGDAEAVAQQAAAAAKAARAAAEKARQQQEEEDAPVDLTVFSEPTDADVIATWKDGGEKRGTAPLTVEVPHNAKVHFAFSKAGYLGLEMDVIADQAQNVKGQLKQSPVVAVDASDKRPPKPSGKTGHKTEGKKGDAAPSKDGLIDLDDALK